MARSRTPGAVAAGRDAQRRHRRRRCSAAGLTHWRDRHGREKGMSARHEEAQIPESRRSGLGVSDRCSMCLEQRALVDSCVVGPGAEIGQTRQCDVKRSMLRARSHDEHSSHVRNYPDWSIGVSPRAPVRVRHATGADEVCATGRTCNTAAPGKRAPAEQDRNRKRIRSVVEPRERYRG